MGSDVVVLYVGHDARHPTLHQRGMGWGQRVRGETCEPEPEAGGRIWHKVVTAIDLDHFRRIDDTCSIWIGGIPSSVMLRGGVKSGSGWSLVKEALERLGEVDSLALWKSPTDMAEGVVTLPAASTSWVVVHTGGSTRRMSA